MLVELAMEWSKTLIIAKRHMLDPCEAEFSPEAMPSCLSEYVMECKGPGVIKFGTQSPLQAMCAGRGGESHFLR